MEGEERRVGDGGRIVQEGDLPDTMTRLSFRATVAREGGDWVAHCLDLDLVATGPTAEAAMDELAGAVEAQLWYARAQHNFEYLFRPAPAEAWERFGEILARQRGSRITAGVRDPRSGV